MLLSVAHQLLLHQQAVPVKCINYQSFKKLFTYEIVKLQEIFQSKCDTQKKKLQKKIVSLISNNGTQMFTKKKQS